MSYKISALKVKDFTIWKSAFDMAEGKALRKAAGMKSYQTFQAADDQNYIVIITEWDTADDGQKFLQSKELKEVGIKSGVIEMFADADTSKSFEEVEKGELNYVTNR